MTVEVKTSIYEFSHGHAPRGFGYWAFQIGEKQEFIQGSQPFPAAKKIAQRMAKDKGIMMIEVLP